MKTVVGLFRTTTEAQNVKQQLVAQGYDASNINVMANDSYNEGGTSGSYSETGTSGSSYTGSETSSTGSGTGIGHKISEFFHNLAGGDDDVHEHYASGVNTGGALLAVRTDDADSDAIASLLRQHGAREIEGDTGNGSYSGTRDDFATAGSTGANLTGETAIPVVEEELVVGKREVDRGGVRVYSHVVEQPVSESVTLRDEQVNVERRPVNRPATAADFTNGTGPIELRATGEEAVVGKTARVVEEVLVGKEASERTETVRDSVRKTEVDVEQIPASAGSTSGSSSLDGELEHAGTYGSGSSTGNSGNRY